MPLTESKQAILDYLVTPPGTKERITRPAKKEEGGRSVGRQSYRGRARRGHSYRPKPWVNLAAQW